MSIVKFKNFSYLRGPKGDKGDKGDSGQGIAGTTGRITYNATTNVVGFNETGLATENYVDSATTGLATESYVNTAIADFATESYVTTTVNNAVSSLVDNAPTLLNTLNEIAAAIGDDASFITTVNSNINGKLSLTGGTLTGSLILNADPTAALGAATKQYVDNAVSTVPTTTDEVTEGTNNLYFTDARARSAISVTGAGSYDNNTGVITVTGGVTSVNTQTGAVVLDTDDVTEGTNQYFTTARARSAISVDGAGSYDSATGVITVTGGVTSVNTQVGAVVLDTDDVTEGSNLYYTTARANTDFDTRLATKSTTDLAEGTNLYYTDTRARLAISAGTNITYDSATGVISSTVTSAVDSVNGQTGTVVLTSTDIAEGTNQYYTDSRSRSAISASGDLSYDSATGVISYTMPPVVVDLTGDFDGGSYTELPEFENSQIIIGGGTYDVTPILPVYSTSAERDAAFPAPATGTMVMTNGSVEVYDGTIWKTLAFV